MATKNDIQQTLKKAKKYFTLGLIIVVIAPFILTSPSIFKGFDFTHTGEIGDTIGGITAPIVNLLAAVLVYFALKAQTQANLMVYDQIEGQQIKDLLQHETDEVNLLFQSLKNSLDNFRFRSFDVHATDGEYLEGNEALYKMIEDFYCDYHPESEEDMLSNPKLTEFLSILEICETILIKLENSKIPNREVMKMLTVHQFQYRIMPRIKMDINNLPIKPCSSCNKDHGFPDRIVALIESIVSKTN